ncbi:hypothetical protein [Lederbergia lenta]|uniref:Uncharacterized protein n=1 Tax=Lederbergia lenta TaxID=1467 RepID=A0A2X4VTE2_LEDLE|nr:hypothetical protein [Lederbergia lenta]MCM3111225.1 hypothetical protein [Lederbergia lenta]MEC2325387.1 hypothetical protein [Lederbergia lenta]SQI55547.1 Uncharacterised protein [Lederbergia lenta]
MKFVGEKNTVLFNFLVLLFSAISASIGLVLWFLIRNTMIVILLYNSIDVWMLPAVDNFAFLILGVLWLVFVFITHHLYNKKTKNNDLLFNFFLISGIQLILLFICETLMFSLDTGRGIKSILLMCGEFLVGLIFIYLTYRRKWNKKKDKSFTSTL